ncbi:hypothetical protein [Anaplasma phagocytophilum]|uniref:hypothetical protein n=1 Tax=Anaplasma phagocytophilum TaxID=948 RepID=UPI0031F882A1
MVVRIDLHLLKNGGAPFDTTNYNATAIAKDIVKELTPKEKTIVAGLLANTIKGGEIVGITHYSIDVKVCRTKLVSTKSGAVKQYAEYKESTETKSNTLCGTSLYGDLRTR